MSHAQGPGPRAEFNKKWAPIIKNLKQAPLWAGPAVALVTPKRLTTDVVDAGFNEPVANTDTDTDESPRLTPAFTHRGSPHQGGRWP
jgi:hypothetical protein